MKVKCLRCGAAINEFDSLAEHCLGCSQQMVSQFSALEAERDRRAEQVKRYQCDEDNVNADGPLEATLWYHCACGVTEDGNEQQECLYHQSIRNERDKYKPYFDALRARHNGYDPELRKDLGWEEPGTPEIALDELIAEAEGD